MFNRYKIQLLCLRFYHLDVIQLDQSHQVQICLYYFEPDLKLIGRGKKTKTARLSLSWAAVGDLQPNDKQFRPPKPVPNWVSFL